MIGGAERNTPASGFGLLFFLSFFFFRRGGGGSWQRSSTLMGSLCLSCFLKNAATAVGVVVLFFVRPAFFCLVLYINIVLSSTKNTHYR